MSRSAHSWIAPWLVTAAGFFLGGVPCGAAEQDLGQLEQAAFHAAVQRVAPSVVRIDTVGGLERVQGVLFGTGPTTGLIIDAEGYVISSAFNFINRPASILVRTPDGARKVARLVATDHNRMLVLLKIDAGKPLPVPDLAAQEPRVGQWAIAVGRAFEGDRTNLSVGIVSALRRVWGKAIQTDAAVSPNNYGGPLVDLQGRVLGVLVPLSPQAESEVSGVEWYDSGIGFAIPAADVQKVLPRLKKGQDLYHGLIGIGFRSRNVHLEEPVVTSVFPNSPAEKAGLKKDDRIIAVDGRPVARAAEVRQELARRYAGDTVKLVVSRGKERITRDVTLVAKMAAYQQPFLGLLPQRAAEGTGGGVGIRYVYPDGPAAQADLRPGDVIVKLAGHEVDDRSDAAEQLDSQRVGADVAVEVRREGKKVEAHVKLAALPTALPPRSLPPAHADHQPGQPQGKTGLFQKKVPDCSNDVWMYVPEHRDPAIPAALVIWLHGPGKFDPPAAVEPWKALCLRHDAILVMPKAGETGRWGSADDALIAGIIEEAAGAYHIDPARVVVAGQESGGTLAYLAGWRHADEVRAVVSVDGPMTDKPRATDPQQPLAFFVARSSGGRAAGAVDDDVARLREMKHPLTLKDLGETPRDLTDDEIAELVRWIDMLDRL